MRVIDPHLHTDRMKGKDLETQPFQGDYIYRFLPAMTRAVDS